MASKKKVKVTVDFEKLFNAVSRNHYSDVKELIDIVEDVNETFNNGCINNNLLLYYLSNYSNISIISLLLESGVKTQIRNMEDGIVSALEPALKLGNYDVVKFLINHGLDVNHVRGNTTLMDFPIKSKRVDLIQLLLDFGFDFNRLLPNYKDVLLSMLLKEPEVGLSYDNFWERLMISKGVDGCPKKTMCCCLEIKTTTISPKIFCVYYKVGHAITDKVYGEDIDFIRKDGENLYFYNDIECKVYSISKDEIQRHVVISPEIYRSFMSVHKDGKIINSHSSYLLNKTVGN